MLVACTVLLLFVYLAFQAWSGWLEFGFAVSPSAAVCSVCSGWWKWLQAGLRLPPAFLLLLLLHGVHISPHSPPPTAFARDPHSITHIRPYIHITLPQSIDCSCGRRHCIFRPLDSWAVR